MEQNPGIWFVKKSTHEKKSEILFVLLHTFSEIKTEHFISRFLLNKRHNQEVLCIILSIEHLIRLSLRVLKIKISFR